MIYEISDVMINGIIAELSVPSRLDVKNTLAPVTAILDRLDHPELKFPSIHVGGTSGKGSTSTFIANILGAAGYKVGLFTKPHLSSVRERFVINGRLISQEDMVDLLDRVASYIDNKPTWFELLTALAFQYFYDQQVDIAVIEVGLGGTYDATNVLIPELSVLTNVGLDHTEILGDTVEKIAADKVGIIKAGKPVVSGVSQPSVIEILKSRCDQIGARLKLLGRDFSYSNCLQTINGSQFSFEMDDEFYPDLELSVLGLHQITNASLALASIKGLKQSGYRVSDPALRNALELTHIPGRMEVIGSNPIILIDGAHSPPKMGALSQGIRTLFSRNRRVIGVLSFSKGHDAASSLSSLASILNFAIFTEFNVDTDYGSRRAQDVNELVHIMAKLNSATEIYSQPDPYKALGLALDLADTDDLICITGSMFLVGQIRTFILQSNKETP